MKTLSQLAVLVILLSACGTTITTPTSPPQLSTLAPTQTFTPKILRTPTMPVTLNACVTDSTIRIRQGAGTEYEVIGGLVSGRCITVLGRNQDSTWVYIVTDDKISGWVAAFLLTIDGDLASVSIRKDSNITKDASPTLTLAVSLRTSTAWVNPFAKTNTPRPVVVQPTAQNSNCSPAYPSVCIPPKPPDLDCGDISYRRFIVLPPDPHGFDGDGDGVGCE